MIEHKQITIEEAATLKGEEANTERKQLEIWVASKDKQPVAIYSITEDMEVGLDILIKQNPYLTVKAIKEGLNLLKKRGYGNLWARADSKYLKAIGL